MKFENGTFIAQQSQPINHHIREVDLFNDEAFEALRSGKGFRVDVLELRATQHAQFFKGSGQFIATEVLQIGVVQIETSQGRHVGQLAGQTGERGSVRSQVELLQNGQWGQRVVEVAQQPILAQMKDAKRETHILQRVRTYGVESIATQYQGGQFGQPRQSCQWTAQIVGREIEYL